MSNSDFETHRGPIPPVSDLIERLARMTDEEAQAAAAAAAKKRPGAVKATFAAMVLSIRTRRDAQVAGASKRLAARLGASNPAKSACDQAILAFVLSDRLKPEHFAALTGPVAEAGLLDFWR